VTNRDTGKEPSDRALIEDAEEGLHGRLDDPNTPLETGPIERGRVDADPTGAREAGYREAESTSQIGRIGLLAIAVILAVLIVGFFIVR
jgi:hypothetical protein